LGRLVVKRLEDRSKVTKKTNLSGTKYTPQESMGTNRNHDQNNTKKQTGIDPREFRPKSPKIPDLNVKGNVPKKRESDDMEENEGILTRHGRSRTIEKIKEHGPSRRGAP